MKNLYLDTITKDLEVYGNNFRFTANDSEYVAQKVDCNFNTWKGEYWLNIDLGIPYLDSIDRRDRTKNILGVSPDYNFLRSVFVKELKSIDEVKRILNIEFLKDDIAKNITVSWMVSLSDNNVLSRSSII